MLESIIEIWGALDVRVGLEGLGGSGLAYSKFLDHARLCMLLGTVAHNSNHKDDGHNDDDGDQTRTTTMDARAAAAGEGDLAAGKEKDMEGPHLMLRRISPV